jgi:dynactin 1
MTLQQELDSLRTQSQTATEESAKAASQTAAMMSLNLKLQSSASKSHARAIEFELKKIEAREAQELLSIVQVGTLVPYLID